MKTPISKDEFPPHASEWSATLSRRQFLETVTASLALAGLSGCTRLPLEKILPYADAPADLSSGQPTFYATTYLYGGFGHGILVENHLGHPTKIEGHPRHPANLGAASAQQQAFIGSLYDPDRSSRVTYRGRESQWSACKKALEVSADQALRQEGKGLYFLTEIISSPSLHEQFQQLRAIYPQMRWIQYEPMSNFRTQQSCQAVFGESLQPVYDLTKASTVVCFEADLFGSPLYPLRYALDFMKKRRAQEGQGRLPALFMAESTLSLTGSSATQHLRVSSADLTKLAQALWNRLTTGKSAAMNADSEAFMQKILMRGSREEFLFAAGESAPEEVHEICHALNSFCGAKALGYVPSIFSLTKDPQEELAELARDLQAGKVEALVIYGGNPVYASAASLGLEAALQKAKTSFHFSLYEDETSAACTWRAPALHSLESWGDARSYDGGTSLIQPMIAPLFAGQSLYSILSVFSGAERSDFASVQDFWKKKWGTKFANKWPATLSAGLLDEPVRTIIPKARKKTFAVKTEPAGVHLVFRADESIGDGRFANNPWLQELPRPLTKLTWENVAFVSEAFAHKNQLKNAQIIKLKKGSAEVKAPVWIQSGQADEAITLTFGYGRKRGGRFAKDRGYNAFALWQQEGELQFQVLTEQAQLACTQDHQNLDPKDVVKSVSEENRQMVRSVEPQSLYPEEPKIAPRFPEAWAMVIDLDSCTGCAACVIACQSENNIPSVGKEAVLQGREMHWIRVDRYFHNSRTYFEPVPCMHCEKAPCELVCPVAATVHSTDGLNQMIYNRCVGTRYCSNNCPYKVRRFNFLTWNPRTPDLAQMQKNPEVSVRPRGVMEKCTYCVQRIQKARILAERELRPIKEGDFQVACQATCPTRAISFGNKNDLQSEVHRLRQSPRHFALLEELGTRPRTTYLAKIEGSHA